jgi:hypothetical protein
MLQHVHITDKAPVNEDDVAYRAYKVRTLHPRRVEGMVLRTSTRWFRHWDSERRTIAVPFVTKCGKFSDANLVTWHAHPEQVVASQTATIYSRLLKIWRGRKQRVKDVNYRTREQLLQVSALYATIHSDYFMDRALALLCRPRPLSRLMDSYLSKIDDKFWFVYRQVSLQAHWLTFQSFGISDKSISKSVLKRFMSSDSKRYRNDTIKDAFLAATDRGLTQFRRQGFNRLPIGRGKPLSKEDKFILAFMDDLSEPDSDFWNE